MVPTLDTITAVAAVVWLYGRDEPGEAQRALASLIANRARAAAAHPVFGDGSLEAAYRSLVATNPLSPPSTGAIDPEAERLARARAFAWACLVLTGEVADATHGAIFFHHHLEDPDWARNVAPRALIGSFFFYDSVAVDVLPPPARAPERSFNWI